MKTTLQKTIIVAMLFALCGLSNVANAQWTSTAYNSGIVPNSGMITIGSDVFVGTTTGLVILSNDGTVKTFPTGIPSNKSVTSVIQVGNNLFASTGVGVYKSTDNGSSWTSSGLDTVDLNGITSTANGIFAGGGKIGGQKGVYRSTDNGNTWTFASTGLSSGYVYLLISSGTTLLASKLASPLYRSTDNGDSWTSVSSMSTVPIYGLSVNGTTIYAGNNNGQIYTSTDDGVTFTNTNNPFFGGSIQGFAFIGTNIFVANNGAGVGLSQNGSNYASQNTGLNNLQTRALAISGNYIYVGTDGGGVYKRPLADWGIVNVNELNHSDNFNIFPNPSTGTFTINYNEEINSVGMYNIIGEKMYSSTNQFHNSMVDFSNQPDGIYFIQIQTANGVKSEKIVINK